MVKLTGPGVSAPYSKHNTLIGPLPGVLSSHLTGVAHHPAVIELTPLPTNIDPPASLMDVDDPMDDTDDDADSFGSDFESIGEDPPGYQSLPIEQAPSNPPSSSSIRDPLRSSNVERSDRETTEPVTDNNCIICQRPKRSQGSATCGVTCEQKLREAQGLNPTQQTGGASSSIGRCPVCTKPKPIDHTFCGSENCLKRLKAWEKGFNPRSFNNHTGSSSYSSVVQTRSQTRPGGQMCAICHLRPRYSHNGRMYPTCGLACAAKLNQSREIEMCDFCHQRPKVVLNGKIYPHCGRTCRDKAKMSSDGSGTGTCTTCLNCWKAPGEFSKDEFCSDSCRAIIERRAPLLLDIPRGHSSFNDVEKEFKSAWNQRRVPCPTIKKIYMVCIPAKQEANHNDYSKKVSSAYSFLSKKKDELRWIPGSRDCPLGHPGILNPCENPQCQLCNVLRGTYLPEIFGKGISTMSLPRAIQQYDYWATNTITIKTAKLVLLSMVSLGKVVEQERFQLSAVPPQGANSVKIVSNAHGYSRADVDEAIVYSCEALRPIYLISYE